MPPIAFATPAPTLAAADAFRRLVRRPGVFWLDSSLKRDLDGGFSVMGAEPRWVFTAHGERWELRHSDGRTETGGHPELPAKPATLARLDMLLAASRVAPPPEAPHLPFFGGAVGWLSYDLGRQFEALPNCSVDDLHTPDIRLAWYDAAIVWDHVQENGWLVGVDGERPAAHAVSELQRWLTAPPISFPDDAPAGRSRLQSDLTREAYMARVENVRQGISRGEYYQLNLVQRFEGAHTEAPAQTYLRLRQHNPAPFAAYLDAGATCVLSSSPERFIEITPEGAIRTCPIKGTRPRGATPAEDEALRTELLANPKERAELLMIVDLLRNDLGRVCVPGSVRVTRLHALESFATVHHLVGEVLGQLRPNLRPSELLRAVFPGGSITGAPKVSALRAIEALEPHRRGIGMGALGYFSAHGRTDLNIAIRTLVCHQGRVYMPVGAGIVWDSDPATEYAETLVKARGLFSALGVTPDGS